jgi:hypothetical protein
MEDRLAQIEQELEAIRKRNSKVEADKAWEGSAERIGTICLLTYFVMASMMCAISVERFWLNALVPVAGFFLSAQSMPIIKRWWIKNRYGAN